MTKSKPTRMPQWVRNLRNLMDKKGYNPRSLSLKAGLSPTAVRDMLEGRSRFPRYDTAKALAAALDTTPAGLMGDSMAASSSPPLPSSGEPTANVELLTEVITRLQAITDEMNTKLEPRDFAAMATTVYRRIQTPNDKENINPQIYNLLDYERLRRNG